MNKKEKNKYLEYKYCINCLTKSKSERVMCETCGCKLPSKIYKRRVILPFVLAFITFLLLIKCNIIYKNGISELIVCGGVFIILLSRLYWGIFNGGQKILLWIYLLLIDFIAAFFCIVTIPFTEINRMFFKIGRAKSYFPRELNKLVMSCSSFVFGMVYIGIISFWALICSLNYMVNDKFTNIYAFIFCMCTFGIPLLMLSFGKFKTVKK